MTVYLIGFSISFIGMLGLFYSAKKLGYWQYVSSGLLAALWPVFTLPVMMFFIFMLMAAFWWTDYE
jgi:hypothetical protein